MMGLYFTDGRLPFPVNHGTSSDDLLLKVKLLTCCFPGSMTSKRMGGALFQCVVVVPTCCAGW